MASRFSRRTVLLAGASLMTAISGAVLIATARKPLPVGYSVPLADVPVGSGIMYIDHGLAVTQPTTGEYKALNTKCPHDNCDVGDIRDGSFICFCHGSLFGLDGSLERGPSRKGLSSRPFEIVDDTMYVTDIPPAM